MPQTRTCSRGHEWDGDPADCPACADDSLGEAVNSTFRDELPPPPRSVRRTQSPKPATAATPGTLVVPGYEVLGELGRGGMGTVYKARHRALNRLVALKVISAGTAADSQELMRFRSEAEAIAQLQHPNIVQVYEAGDVSGRPYLALELVEGGTLAQALGGTPLPAQTAAELLETLARAVEYAHSRGIVHRDLKPGNVLIQKTEDRGRKTEDRGQKSEDRGQRTEDRGSCKIADFGLAKRIGVDSSLTTTGIVVGTPSYMSPEQAAGLGKLIGPASDIYALGAILYELLTGRPPFQSPSPIDTLQQVVSIEPVPPTRLQPKVPRDLETICLKCLQKESRKRYASSAALADDLRRFLDGRPIVARRTPIWERGMKWARRRPAAAALILVSLLATVALAGLGIRFYRALERHNVELSKAAVDLARERDEARKQSKRAEVNLESATEAIEEMLKRVGFDDLARVPFMDRTRQRLLDEALRFFDKLLAAQGNDPRLLLLQAHTYYYSGTIHLQFNRFEDARNQYERGLKLLSDLRHRPDSPIPLKTLVALQARIQNQQGLLFAQMGDPSAARAELEAALALREQLAAEQPDVPDHKFDIVGSYVNLALIARTEGKADRTELYLGRARVQSEELLKKYPDRPLFLYYYTTVLNDLAVFYMEHRDYPSAVPLLERSVEHLRKLAESDAEAIYFRSDLARALSNLGSAWREQGYLRKAAGLYSEALALREHLHRTHPFIRPFAVDLAMTEFHIGEIHRTKDEFTDAVEWHTQAINRLDVRLAKAAIDTRARKAAFDAYLARSEALAALNKKPDALNDLNRAVELADDRHRPKAKMARALMLARTGKISDATVEADAALKMAEPIGDMLFDAARTYAIAAGADKSGKARHGARAVEMLTNAEKAGFFRSAAAREQLESNSDFQAIKNRGDFKSLSDRVRAMD